MPSGIPVATMAINGAKNAALLAASIISTYDKGIAAKLDEFRKKQTEKIVNTEI